MNLRPAVASALALALALALTTVLPAVAREASNAPSGPVLTIDREGASVQLIVRRRAVVAEWDPVSNRARMKGEARSRTLRDSPSAAGRKIEVAYAMNASDVIVERVVRHERRGEDGHLLPLQWAASTDEVQLTWPTRPGVSTWRVLRDGRQIATTQGNNFMARGPRNQSHTYTIVGERPVVLDSGKTASQPFLYQTTVPKTDRSALGKKIDDQSILSVADNEDIASQSSAGDHIFRGVYYHSFITEEHIAAPFPCAPLENYAYFGGDGRGFLDYGHMIDYWGGPYTSRLHASVASAWNAPGEQNPNPGMREYNPYVGTSHAYNDLYEPVASDTASTDGIVLESADSTSAIAFRRVTADVPNPLCTGSPAINWDYSFSNTVDGWINVWGEFDQAPSTEILWEAANFTTGWMDAGCWFRFENRGFDHLFPPYPNGVVDIDANPRIAKPDCPTL